MVLAMWTMLCIGESWEDVTLSRARARARTRFDVIESERMAAAMETSIKLRHNGSRHVFDAKTLAKMK